MHPSHYLRLFPAFPTSHRVFVAMSFDDGFLPRWRDVIEPAVGRVFDDGQRLQPFRVDARVVSDSILTEILEAVTTARLIIADVSTIGYLGKRPVRNENVMYELGIAQSCRLPEEIILFRSDQDDLPFDLANVRVNRFDPNSDPEGARSTVAAGVESALKEIDLRRQLSIRSAVPSVDWEAFRVLAEASTPNGLIHPELRTMGQVLANVLRYSAMQRLLSIGAIETVYPRIHVTDVEDRPNDALRIRYKVTDFGEALMQAVAKGMGGDDPELMRKAAEMLEDEGDDATPAAD